MGDRAVISNKNKQLGVYLHWYGYREFVDDIGHKYTVEEDEIKKSMGEDDLWLPW